jgi:hypothetical protein
MLFVIHARDRPGALKVRLAHYDTHKAFLADPNPMEFVCHVGSPHVRRWHDDDREPVCR